MDPLSAATHYTHCAGDLGDLGDAPDADAAEVFFDFLYQGIDTVEETRYVIEQSEYDEISSRLVGAGYDPLEVEQFCGLLDKNLSCDHIAAYLDRADAPLYGFVLANSTRLEHRAYHALASEIFSPTRLAIASNPTTPGCVLGELAFDVSNEISCAIMYNRNLDEITLWALSHHPECYVRDVAQMHLTVFTRPKSLGEVDDDAPCGEVARLA